MATPTAAPQQEEQQCYLQQVFGDIRTYPAPLPMTAEMQACIGEFGYQTQEVQRPEFQHMAQENIGKSANITSASSSTSLVKKRIDKPQQLQRRVSDGDQKAKMDCERDEELLTDHQVQMAHDAQQRPAQAQMLPPPAESATPDF